MTEGLVKSIGVSNFGGSEIDALMHTWIPPPVRNQIQVSPFEYRRALIEKSETAGLVVQAYSRSVQGATCAIRWSTSSLGSTNTHPRRY